MAATIVRPCLSFTNHSFITEGAAFARKSGLRILGVRNSVISTTGNRTLSSRVSNLRCKSTFPLSINQLLKQGWLSRSSAHVCDSDFDGADSIYKSNDACQWSGDFTSKMTGEEAREASTEPTSDAERLFDGNPFSTDAINALLVPKMWRGLCSLGLSLIIMLPLIDIKDVQRMIAYVDKHPFVSLLVLYAIDTFLAVVSEPIPMVTAFARERWLAVCKILSFLRNVSFCLCMAFSFSLFRKTFPLPAPIIGMILGFVIGFAVLCIIKIATSGLSFQGGSMEGQVTDTPSIKQSYEFRTRVLDDGSSSFAKKIHLHIDDMNRIPHILDGIESMMKSKTYVSSEKEPPFCHLFQTKDSFAELTIGFVLKDLDHDTFVSSFLDILQQSEMIIRDHGGLILR